MLRNAAVFAKSSRMGSMLRPSLVAKAFPAKSMKRTSVTRTNRSGWRAFACPGSLLILASKRTVGSQGVLKNVNDERISLIGALRSAASRARLYR